MFSIFYVIIIVHKKYSIEMFGTFKREVFVSLFIIFQSF